jgi:hypothetical protein
MLTFITDQGYIIRVVSPTHLKGSEMHKSTLPVNGGAMPNCGRAESDSISKISVSAARRAFIGGSDARTIMGDDEASLIRLWKEKRGEIEPTDFSGGPPGPARDSDGAAEPSLVRKERGSGCD